VAIASIAFPCNKGRSKNQRSQKKNFGVKLPAIFPSFGEESYEHQAPAQNLKPLFRIQLFRGWNGLFPFTHYILGSAAE
jgi:hypothetical protein